MSQKATRPESALPRAPQPHAGARARPASAMPTLAGGKRSSATTRTPAVNPSAQRPPRATSAAAARPGVTAQPAVASAGDAAQRDSGQSEMMYFQEQVYRLQRELQDLKEMEQAENAQYRRQLRRYYNGNAVLRNIIAGAERRARNDGELNPDLPASVTEAEVDHLQYRINLARRRQNRLSHDLKVATRIVENDKAAVDEAISSLQPTQAEMTANRPAFLRKHRLERRLNDILSQQQTIDVVIKGYTHHLEELHQEGLHYDAQMQTVEKELKDRHRDQAQLVTLFRNAKKEYQTAAQDREEFLRKFESGRAAKDKALAEKRDVVEQQLDVTREQANRLTVLEQQIEDEAQLLESAENVEAQLEAELLGGRNALAVLTGGGASGSITAAQRGAATVQEEEKLSAYEKLFRVLLEKAKVTDPEDLVSVFETELQGQVSMIDEVESRRVACAQLREEVQHLREKVDDARLCGLSRQPAATPALEAELKQFTHEEQARLMASVHHQQETETSLAEMVRRVNLIATLMSGYRPDVSVPPLVSSKDAMFLLHTAVLAQKVLALADDTVPTHNTRKSGGGHSGGGGAVVAVSGADVPPVTVRSTQLVVPANNVRIPLGAQDHNASGRPARKLTGGTYGKTKGAAAGMSSKAGARLLDMRRGSRGGMGRVSMDSFSLAGAAGNGLSEDYGLVPESSAHLAREEESDNEDSSEDNNNANHARASAAQDAAAPPSPLASTAAPRRQGGPKRSLAGAVPGGAGASPAVDVTAMEDDPLRREEIKKMSETLLLRQKRREEQELRRQNKSAA